MHSSRAVRVLCVVLAVLDIAIAAPQNFRNGNGNTDSTGTGNGGGSSTTLNTANIQDASASDGNPDATAGQSASLTDDSNFINFCDGKTITNGLQNRGGSCNGIVMGDIPAQGNMISSIIINPGPGDDIAADTDFEIQVQVSNLQAGTFTNPDVTYYAAPQQLQGGRVVGHTHVTVQDLGGSLAPNTPPDASTFAFFKGINDDGNGNGLLSATVTGGLPAGNYRVCTMTSSSNHQPVLMPVAQRGAQDDCQKFTVGGNGNGNGNSGNSGKAATGASTGNSGSGNSGSTGSGSTSDGSADVSSSSTTTSARAATSATSASAAASTTVAEQGSATTTRRSRSSSTSSSVNSSGTSGTSGTSGSGRFSGGSRQRHRFNAREFVV